VEKRIVVTGGFIKDSNKRKKIFEVQFSSL
jgi:hypothetical protein